MPRSEGLPTADVSMVIVGALARRPGAGESRPGWDGFESDMDVAVAAAP